MTRYTDTELGFLSICLRIFMISKKICLDAEVHRYRAKNLLKMGKFFGLIQRYVTLNVSELALFLTKYTETEVQCLVFLSICLRISMISKTIYLDTKVRTEQKICKNGNVLGHIQRYRALNLS